MKTIYKERSHLSAHANDGKFTLCGHDYRMTKIHCISYYSSPISDSTKLHNRNNQQNIVH